MFFVLCSYVYVFVGIALLRCPGFVICIFYDYINQIHGTRGSTSLTRTGNNIKQRTLKGAATITKPTL
jgi:hypothetical protein